MKAFRPKSYKPARKVTRSKGKAFNPATGTTVNRSDGSAGGRKPVNHAPKILHGGSSAVSTIFDAPLKGLINSMSGLVTYLPMDGLNGTVVNQSPNNTNPGVASNITLADGKVGKSFAFNGTNSGVALSNTTFPSTDFSVLCLVKRSGTQEASDRLIDYAAGGPDGGFDILFPTGNVNKLRLGIWNTTVLEASISTDADLTDGQWYLVVGTYTANSAKFYLNATQQGATDTAVTCSAPAAQSVNIGKRSAAGTNYFTGNIQHFALFSRVLTQQEVTDLAAVAGV